MPSLNFSTHFGDKQKTPTFFKEKILNNYWSDGFKWIEKPYKVELENPKTFGKKIHTIRQNHRFKAGDMCHLFTGLRTKNTHKFGICECVSVQKIKIHFYHLAYDEKLGKNPTQMMIYIDDTLYPTNNHVSLVRNDGLTSKQFKDWFYKVTNNGTQTFEGQIIHWTDLQY